MPKEVFYWVAMCEQCAISLNARSMWISQPAITLPRNSPPTCGVCDLQRECRSVKSRVSNTDLRSLLALVTRNSNEAKRQREEEERERKAREVELRALELAVQMAKQSTPAQIRAKLADAKRVVPTKKRVITLE